MQVTGDTRETLVLLLILLAFALLKAGESTELAGYTYTLRGIAPVQGANFSARQATVEVSHGGRPVVTLTPAKRTFALAKMTTSEAAWRR